LLLFDSHLQREEIPRNLEFLFSRNRLIVAVSRALCLGVLVCCPALLEIRCRSAEQMRPLNSLCLFVVNVTVERVTLNDNDQIVAICSREGLRQTIPLLDLPLPTPPPAGAQWIEAYRHWHR
jgi:hypothetical protein